MSLSSWGVVIGLGDKQRRRVFILIIVFCQILDPDMSYTINNLKMLPIASYLDSTQKHALMGRVSSVIFLQVCEMLSTLYNQCYSLFKVCQDLQN